MLYSFTHMATVGFKGLINGTYTINCADVPLRIYSLTHSHQ